MDKRISIFVVLVVVVFLVVTCGQKEPVELKHYTLENTEGIITKSGVEIDKQITTDGNGSLKITTEDSTVVRLFEVGDIDVEDARLIYRAGVRTENVAGKVFLEMWCHFPGKGEFFSRGLQTALTGSSDWNSQETFFFLKKGENPDNVKLNLVISGKGTVWIDDIHLIKGPLN
jgi:hypothetical protein